MVELLISGSSVLVSLVDGWDISTQLRALARPFPDPFHHTQGGFVRWRGGAASATAGRARRPRRAAAPHRGPAVPGLRAPGPPAVPLGVRVLPLLPQGPWLLPRIPPPADLPAGLGPGLGAPGAGAAAPARGGAQGPQARRPVWGCAHEPGRRTRVFHHHAPDDTEVWRPYGHGSSLKVWGFYTEETLAGRTPLCLGAGPASPTPSPQRRMRGTPQSRRRVLGPCHDSGPSPA